MVFIIVIMDMCIECNRIVTGRHYYHYRINSKAQLGKWLIREWCHYFVYYLPLIFIASLPFYLLCQFLKSEADIVEVTVMEVYREEKSVFVLVQSLFQTDFLFYGRNIEITCTGSKPTPCIFLNIVF